MKRGLIFILGFLFFMAVPKVTFGQALFEVSGTVLDENSGEPVPFAQVGVYPPQQSTPFKGTVTAENGDFLLELEKGRYEIAIILVGYEEKRIKVKVKDADIHLGNLDLATTTQQLDEVVIEGTEINRPVTTDVEGLVVRPDQTISNVGGTVLDVLRNSPSIKVNDDGSVSLRGSENTNILIDGRNSALGADLEQLPASAVESIKIITNPNSKYDAEAEGGIINIQLKKNEVLGTKASVEGTIGTRYRLNSNLRLSHRTEKINIFGGYSYRNWPGVSDSRTTRLEYGDDSSQTERLEQDRFSERNDREHTFNMGADYYFGRNKLSYEGVFNTEKEADNDLVNSQRFVSGAVASSYSRTNVEKEDNYTFDNALIFEREFSDSVKEFRLLASHSYRDLLETQTITGFSEINQPSEVTGRERSSTDERRETVVFQTDYSQALLEGKLEVGLKSILRSFDNDFLYETYDSPSMTWENRPNVSNRFLYEDKVFAGYLIYSRSLGSFDVSIGTRAEQTLVNTKLYNSNEENDQSYLDFFPSVQILYQVKDNHSLKLTYSKRIDRPNAWRLNPFPDITDSLNIRTGNPELNPEYIQSFELGHMIDLPKGNVTYNFFYRHIDGQLDYIVRIDEGIATMRPENLNTAQTYGLEVISAIDLKPWWNVTSSLAMFRSVVDGTNIDASYNNKGYSGNAKLTSEFNLFYDIDMQITANYEAPEIEAQGKDLSRYYADISLQRPFLDNKAKITLTLRDIFDTQRFAGENEGEGFYQEFERNWESRIFLATFSYTIK